MQKLNTIKTEKTKNEKENYSFTKIEIGKNVLYFDFNNKREFKNAKLLILSYGTALQMAEFVENYLKYDLVEIRAFEDVLIEKKNCSDISLYTSKVKFVNVAKMQKAIESLGNREDILNFARVGKIENLKSLTRAIIRAKGSVDDLLDFAKEIEGVDIEKIENEIALNGDRIEILKCAKKVSKDPNKLVDAALYSNGDVCHLTDFAQIEGLNEVSIQKLESAVIQGGDYYEMLKFAKKVKCANLSRLEEKILQRESPELCLLWIEEGLLTDNFYRHYKTILNSDKNDLKAKLLRKNDDRLLEKQKSELMKNVNWQLVSSKEK